MQITRERFIFKLKFMFCVSNVVFVYKTNVIKTMVINDMDGIQAKNMGQQRQLVIFLMHLRYPLIFVVY